MKPKAKYQRLLWTRPDGEQQLIYWHEILAGIPIEEFIGNFDVYQSEFIAEFGGTLEIVNDSIPFPKPYRSNDR